MTEHTAISSLSKISPAYRLPVNRTSYLSSTNLPRSIHCSQPSMCSSPPSIPPCIIQSPPTQAHSLHAVGLDPHFSRRPCFRLFALLCLLRSKSGYSSSSSSSEPMHSTTSTNSISTRSNTRSKKGKHAVPTGIRPSQHPQRTHPHVKQASRFTPSDDRRNV